MSGQRLTHFEHLETSLFENNCREGETKGARKGRGGANAKNKPSAEMNFVGLGPKIEKKNENAQTTTTPPSTQPFSLNQKSELEENPNQQPTTHTLS